MVRTPPTALWPCLLAVTCICRTQLPAGEIELRVVEADTEQPIGARLEITDQRGRHPHPARFPFWQKEFTIDGPCMMKLTAGTYMYRVERGPEYHGQFGTFVMSREATDSKLLTLKRHITMRDRGWWSGDPWVERKREQMATLIFGEDLHVGAWVAAPGTPPTVEAISSATDRIIDGHVRRLSDPGGELLIRVSQALAADTVGDPIDTLAALDQARKNAHVEILEPAAWHTPVYLSDGKIKAMVVLRPSDPRTAAICRPPNPTLFPPAEGEDRYRESIYYQALNAGLQLVPVAASGSGYTNAPPGSHRTYVGLGAAPFSLEAWWKGLEQGNVVVTNGPLLVPSVNGKPPGHVFHGGTGDVITLQTSLTLHTRTKIDYLQFIKNGESVAEVRLDEFAKQGGALPKVEFSESGWMIIRAVANNADRYESGWTAPFYVQFADQHRISRAAVQYFQDWLIDSARQLRRRPAAERAAALPAYRAARKFWEARATAANAP